MLVYIEASEPKRQFSIVSGATSENRGSMSSCRDLKVIEKRIAVVHGITAELGRHHQYVHLVRSHGLEGPESMRWKSDEGFFPLTMS